MGRGGRWKVEELESETLALPLSLLSLKPSFNGFN